MHTISKLGYADTPSIIIITLCAYAQQGYAFGRVGLCA